LAGVSAQSRSPWLLRSPWPQAKPTRVVTPSELSAVSLANAASTLPRRRSRADPASVGESAGVSPRIENFGERTDYRPLWMHGAGAQTHRGVRSKSALEARTVQADFAPFASGLRIDAGQCAQNCAQDCAQTGVTPGNGECRNSLKREGPRRAE
jgi:hypothetical protein